MRVNGKHSSTSSISSRPPSVNTNKQDIVVYADGIPILPLSPQITDDTSTSKTTKNHDNCYSESVFRVHWTFEPLLQHVVTEGSLLALHICCFYSASVEVVQVIAKANPAAALYDVIGMLPIHMVAAGWTLPPLLPPPPGNQTLSTDGTTMPKDQILALSQQQTMMPILPIEILDVLQKTIPNTVFVRSTNHGMTPEDYVQECMEEGDCKEFCLHMLRTDDSYYGNDIIVTCNAEDDHQSPSVASSRGDGLYAGSDVSSIHNDDAPQFIPTESLVTMMESHDWEGVLAAIEQHPSIAARWMYGIDPTVSTVWKRLPLHMVCDYSDAPIGVVSLLLQFYPDAVYSVDAIDGSSPLHRACKANVPQATLKLLLSKGPDATFIANAEMQLPLHMAIQAKASYDTIEALVAEHPQAVSSVDCYDKTPMDYAKIVYGHDHITYELLTMIYHYLHEPEI